MARMLINGVNLNVDVVGEGPPVLALHGFTGDMSTWDGLVRDAETEFTFVRVDLLGHGGSDSPLDADRYSMECCVCDLLGVLDALDVHRAIWLGYSMGGRICLHAAMSEPERFQALILESASYGIVDEGERMRRREKDARLADMIEEEGISTFVDYWETQPLFKSQERLPKDVRERVRSQRLQNDPVGLANSLLSLSTGRQLSLHNNLSFLDFPILFVAGREDDKFCRIGRSLTDQVAGGAMTIIPEAGHAVHLEQPERFNEAVLDFMRAHNKRKL